MNKKNSLITKFWNLVDRNYFSKTTVKLDHLDLIKKVQSKVVENGEQERPFFFNKVQNVANKLEIFQKKELANGFLRLKKSVGKKNPKGKFTKSRKSSQKKKQRVGKKPLDYGTHNGVSFEPIYGNGNLTVNDKQELGSIFSFPKVGKFGGNKSAGKSDSGFRSRSKGKFKNIRKHSADLGEVTLSAKRKGRISFIRNCKHYSNELNWESYFSIN